jgi:hypothetical protein
VDHGYLSWPRDNDIDTSMSCMNAQVLELFYATSLFWTSVYM